MDSIIKLKPPTMTREEQLKQAIEEDATLKNDLAIEITATYWRTSGVNGKWNEVRKKDFANGAYWGVQKALSTPSILRHCDPEIMKQAGWVREEEWISVEDRLPEINQQDQWDKEHNISKDVWTYSEFGMVKGRYYHISKHWTIDNVSSSKGINVTHWKPLPQPPKQ